MIIGIGNDITDVRRIGRALRRRPRFPAKVLCAQEVQLFELQRRGRRDVFLAGRWAAKEALGKALGCGIRAPLTLPQIAVLNDAQGKPAFHFLTAAAAFVRARGVTRCHLSLSHDGHYASAVVVLEGGNTQ